MNCGLSGPRWNLEIYGSERALCFLVFIENPRYSIDISYPRTARKLPWTTRQMSTAQRSVLLALSSVSLAALFVWYIQSRRKSGPRQILGDNQTSINIRSEQERSAIKPTERSSHKIEEVGVSANLETSQSGSVSCDTEHWYTAPTMTNTLGSDPAVTINSSTLHSNRTNESTESQSNIVGSKDERLLAKTTEEKRSVEERCSEEKHECEKTDLHLVLDVSYQAEPQAFSWSDEMEKCYTVELKKKEEEQRQYENNVGNNGSGDYATSDSPGLASQNSEERIGTVSILVLFRHGFYSFVESLLIQRFETVQMHRCVY